MRQYEVIHVSSLCRFRNIRQSMCIFWGSHEPASLLRFSVPFRKYSAREFGCYPAQLVLMHLIAETDTEYITDNVFMPVKSVRTKTEKLSATLEKRR